MINKMKTNHVTKTHKFGILKQDIIEIMKTPLPGIEIVGLSIHIGSQLTDFKATKKAVIEICEPRKHILVCNNLRFHSFSGFII